MTGLDLLSPCDNAEVDFCRHYRRRDRRRRARAIAIGGATSGKGCINYYTVSIYGTVLPIRPTITDRAVAFKIYRKYGTAHLSQRAIHITRSLSR